MTVWWPSDDRLMTNFLGRGDRPLQILANPLNLSQSGGQIMHTNLLPLAPPPWFSDFPTALSHKNIENFRCPSRFWQICPHHFWQMPWVIKTTLNLSVLWLGFMKRIMNLMPPGFLDLPTALSHENGFELECNWFVQCFSSQSLSHSFKSQFYATHHEFETPLDF